MARIEGICKEVLEKTEWAAIVTGDEIPHLVATWGDYIKVVGEGTIVIPAGHYNKTEENLKKNKHVQLLIASRQVTRSDGQGQGCIIDGEGEIQTEGKFVQLAKEKFSWARGALVIEVKGIRTLL